MKDNEIIKTYKLKEKNIDIQDVAIIRKRKRQKDLNEYNCFCVRTGYNQDFIDFIHESKFESVFLKQTLERAVDADANNISYVIGHLTEYFKYIIIETKIGNIKIPGYKTIITENGYKYFEKIQKEVSIQDNTKYLLKKEKEIKIDNLMQKIQKNYPLEDIDYINILENEDSFMDLDKIRPTFKTKYKIIILKIKTRTNYNSFFLFFNTEYGTIDSVYYEYSIELEAILDNYYNLVRTLKTISKQPIIYR
jgi:hypothetical protein